MVRSDPAAPAEEPGADLGRTIPRPLRVLFVQDHLGQTPALVHGVTRYFESGLLVPMADVPALAEALVSVLTDAQLRRALGRGARRRSALFSVARHVDELQTIDRAVIAARLRQGRTARVAALHGLATEPDRDHRPPP